MSLQQKMMDSVVSTSNDTTLTSLERKLQHQKQVEEYKGRVETLADKIVKYSQSQSPVSAQMIEVLVPFLEVSIVMEGIIETMTELNSVINLIGTATELLDQTMESSQKIITGTMGVKYGWVRRIKRKIMMAQAKANNRARARQICDQVSGLFEIASDMRSIFGTIPAEMNRAMEKVNGRKRRGKGEAPAPYEMSPGVKALLASKGAKFDNLGYDVDGNAPVPAPASGADMGTGRIFKRSPESSYSEDL